MAAHRLRSAGARGGRWWTPISGAFFARIPAQYIPVLGGYVLMAGFAEWRLGTRWTVITTVAGQLLSVLGTAAICALFRDSGWTWAVDTGRALDVGFSSGAICALVVAAMTLRAPWRARLVVAVFGYCLVSLVWVGLVWDVEHMIAAALGLAIGWPRARSLFEGDGHLSRHEARVIATALMVLIAFAQILAMVFPEDGPLGPEETVVGRPLIVLFVVAELLVAAGLHRGSRLAWSAATALSITGLLTSTALRPVPRGVAAAVVFLPLLIVLVRTRRAYTARVIPPSSIRMTRDLALLGIGFILYVVLGFIVIEDFNPPPDLVMQARELIARLFFSSSGTFQATGRPGTWSSSCRSSLIPIIVFFSVLLVLLIRTRKPVATVNRERTIELLHTYGGGNLSWMTTWPDNAHFVTADGKAAIAYQVKSGTAIALGDPIGDPESVSHAVLEFARYCETHGWMPCLLLLDAGGAAAGPEPRLPLRPGGRGHGDRPARPAVQGQGVAGRPHRTEPRGQVQHRVPGRASGRRVVPDGPAGPRHLRAVGLGQGSARDGLHPRRYRRGPRPRGPGRAGRRRPRRPPGHHLVAAGLRSGRRRHRLDPRRHATAARRVPAGDGVHDRVGLPGVQGAGRPHRVSLSGAPLARSEDDVDSLGAVDTLLNQLGEMLEPVYGFRSLHQFKTKFKPRYEPMYMVFPDEAALPRVGVALTQAFLPDARLRDYASVLRS